MGTLHLVSSLQALDDCLTLATAADAIVLLEDGVYAVNNPLPVSSANTTDAPTCYVVANDLDIRGIACPDHLPNINYDELVVLCTQHSPIATWC